MSREREIIGENNSSLKHARGREGEGKGEKSPSTLPHMHKHTRVGEEGR